jgi:UDP-N-acetylmuramoyl-tripeptide--D-alanyl-D-alanine ligase
VRVLCGLHGRGRRVLVLGDMLELGPDGPELHHAVGRDAAAGGVDVLVAVGELARAAAAGALEWGMPPARVLHVASAGEALDGLDSVLREGDTVLFKASRKVGLERVVEGLVERRGALAR